MADTRQELETAVFDLAARVATVRAALSGAITNDVDQADRLDVLEGCHRVLGDAMESMWTAWEQFDQRQATASPLGALPAPGPHAATHLRWRRELDDRKRRIASLRPQRPIGNERAPRRSAPR